MADDAQGNTGSPDHEVRYSLPSHARPNRRATVVIIAVVMVVLASCAWAVSRGGVPISGIGCLTVWFFMWWRRKKLGRDAVANQTGIYGPQLLRPLLRKDIASLEEPLRYDPVIYAVMKNGARKSTGFPPDYFQQLVDVGGCDVKPQA